MLIKRIPLYGIFICGMFLLLDQWLKWQSLNNFSETHLIGNWFGWMPFLNRGVAFGIPLPMPVVIFITVPVVIVMSVMAYRYAKQETKASSVISLGLISIVAGSLSNLADRIFYQSTVDYFLIGTGVINVADLLILIGFVLFFFTFRNLQRG